MKKGKKSNGDEAQQKKLDEALGVYTLRVNKSVQGYRMSRFCKDTYSHCNYEKFATSYIDIKNDLVWDEIYKKFISKLGESTHVFI